MDNNTSGASLSSEPTKIFNVAFITIFLGSMMYNLGFGMTNAILSVYARSIGASPTEIGMVMGTFAIASILLRFISAPIMDTYNRKYIVIIAALGLSAAFTGFSVSHSIPSIMVFRLLQGAGMAFGNACFIAMVSETIPKDKYGVGIGYFTLGQVISSAVGPFLALSLSGRFGYPMAFRFNAGVMIISAALAFTIKINYTKTKKLKLTFSNAIAKEALIPSAALILISTGSTVIQSFLVVFARGQGITANVGLYFTVSSLTMLLARPAIGKLTDKFGIIKVIIPAIFCSVIAFFFVSISNQLWTILLAAAFNAFGFGAVNPAIQALSMKAVPKDRRGSASSTNYIGNDLGNLFGPVPAGMIAGSLGYPMMWRIMSCTFILCMLYLFIFRKYFARIEEKFKAGN